MILAVISYFYYILAKKLLDNYATKNLQELKKSSEAISIRKKIKIIRWIGLGIIFIIYIIIYVMFVLLLDKDGKPLNFAISGLLSLAISYLTYEQIIRRVVKVQTGNISIYSKSEWISKHPSYFIYLRAFDSDESFTTEAILLKKDVFSEYHFMTLLENQDNFCAIGLTKELDSPYGASRVYVDDDTWKADVFELMERSQAIVILVSDRPSCLWEIEQSFKFLDKTTYIFQDKNKYEVVKTLFAKTHTNICLPELPKEHTGDNSHFYINYKDEFIVSSFDNTIESYGKIITDSTGIILYKGKANGCIQTVFKIAVIIILIVLCIIISNG